MTAASATVRLGSACFEVPDTSSVALDAMPLAAGAQTRDTAAVAELRAQALLDMNRGLLRDYRINGSVRRRGGRPELRLQTGTCVGALPLLSPATGRVDYGLVIRPRFLWSSVGVVLAQTGLKIVPELLPLPDLPRSERKVPPWVLSSIVLRRIQALLERLSRRFELVRGDRVAPRGRVEWPTYARDRIPRGRGDLLPCLYSDLRDDEELHAAIHHVLRLEQASLATQRSAGQVVLELLALCELLLAKVAGTPPSRPPSGRFEAWRRRPLCTRAFREGLQALEWTMEERGLAGSSDLSGMAWRLDMERFFEAWVESIAQRLGRACGAAVRSGRAGQTVVPLSWEPPHAGTQRALIPDVVLCRDDLTVILDAKYKRHLEEIELSGWRGVDEDLRDYHREDLMQVLAYSTLYSTQRVVACLVYPCSPETYASLKVRRRTYSRARLGGASRNVELVLAAAPMGQSAEEVSRELEPLLARS